MQKTLTKILKKLKLAYIFLNIFRFCAIEQWFELCYSMCHEWMNQITYLVVTVFLLIISQNIFILMFPTIKCRLVYLDCSCKIFLLVWIHFLHKKCESIEWKNIVNTIKMHCLFLFAMMFNNLGLYYIIYILLYVIMYAWYAYYLEN